MARPFEGVRIIDTTHVLAGPFCTYQLALLGANVIRVENPDKAGMDMTRRGGTRRDLNEQGIGTSFLAQNANKRSIALDLKHPDAKPILNKLISGADVMVENFRPGVMERLGFGYAAASALNPSLIYASLTGYGQDGPKATAPIYDHVMQAASGLMSVAGTEGKPERIRFPLIDFATGLSGAYAVASALFQRTHTGKGQRVDVSMLDAAFMLLTSGVGQVLTSGDIVRPRGNIAASGSPFSGFFSTADGTLGITANTYPQAVRLCRCLGCEDILDDRRFDEWALHPELADEYQAQFLAIYATRSADEWEAMLNDAAVPAAKVRDLPDTLAQPQAKNRASVLSAGYFEPLGEELKVPGVTFKLEHGGAEVTSPPPGHGEQTDEILGELGYDEAQITALRQSNAVA